MRVQALVGIVVLASCRSFGQTAMTSPSFEVVSVKAVDSSDKAFEAVLAGRRRSGGRITWTTTRTSLLLYAYHLPAWRIVGMEEDQSFYSINATTDPSATEDQVRLMLQRLLADRFKLVAHRITKELQGYALVVAKNGPKIKTATALKEAPPMPEYIKGGTSALFEGQILVSKEGRGTAAITGRGVSMSLLADTLSETLGTFVLDRTGMTGNYYFGFKFLKDSAPSDAEGPTLFIALQEELGLKLKRQKGPLEVLVVDHLEKLPGEN
jgi:uncharacterized protein (TIGR03435 family)